MGISQLAMKIFKSLVPAKVKEQVKNLAAILEEKKSWIEYIKALSKSSEPWLKKTKNMHYGERCFIIGTGCLSSNESGNIPRHLKTPLLISVKGLGYVTHPEFLRDGRIFGDNCGLLEVDRHYAQFEIRHQKDIKILNNITNLLIGK